MQDLKHRQEESSPNLRGIWSAASRQAHDPPHCSTPRFLLNRAAGSRITDADGKSYLDLHTSFGAALLGHGHPRLCTAAVYEALSRGILCGFEVEASGIAARKLVEECCLCGKGALQRHGDRNHLPGHQIGTGVHRQGCCDQVRGAFPRLQ